MHTNFWQKKNSRNTLNGFVFLYLFSSFFFFFGFLNGYCTNLPFSKRQVHVLQNFSTHKRWLSGWFATARTGHMYLNPRISVFLFFSSLHFPSIHWAHRIRFFRSSSHSHCLECSFRTLFTNKKKKKNTLAIRLIAKDFANTNTLTSNNYINVMCLFNRQNPYVCNNHHLVLTNRRDVKQFIY